MPKGNSYELIGEIIREGGAMASGNRMFPTALGKSQVSPFTIFSAIFVSGLSAIRK